MDVTHILIIKLQLHDNDWILILFEKLSFQNIYTIKIILLKVITRIKNIKSFNFY